MCNYPAVLLHVFGITQLLAVSAATANAVADVQLMVIRSAAIITTAMITGSITFVTEVE